MSQETHDKLIGAGMKAGISVIISSSQILGKHSSYMGKNQQLQHGKNIQQHGKKTVSLMQKILGPEIDILLRSVPMPDDSNIIDDVIPKFNPSNKLNGDSINLFMSILQSKYQDTIWCVDTYLTAKLCARDYAPEGVRRWKGMMQHFSAKKTILFPWHESVECEETKKTAKKKTESEIEDSDLTLVSQPVRSGKILVGIHWTLIAADLNENKLKFYDSMSGSPDMQKLVAVERFLKDKGEMYPGDSALLSKQWKYEFYGPDEIPKQHDSVSCGKFVCAFSGLIAAGIPLKNSFVEKDLSSFGHEMQLQFNTLAKHWRGNIPPPPSLPKPLTWITLVPRLMALYALFRRFLHATTSFSDKKLCFVFQPAV